MGDMIKAIEVAGAIDEHGQLHLDAPLPVTGPSRVRAIILISQTDEADEREWLLGAARNPAFAFLDDPAEDIYTRVDGKPFHDTP